VSILVTGGGGFLGSHLVERLQGEGVEPFVARRRDYDLTRREDAERLFEEAQPELVFHLAAEVGGIGANRANPGRYWFANLMMGAHVLDLSRLHGVGKLVLTGTVCAYPKHTPVPFHEEELWNGYPEETNAPYGVAKKSILVGAQAYREQYGLESIFLLPTNLYGPRDNFDLATSHVIPALIRKMHESPEEVVLWGDGSPTREYLYVDDCVDGLLLAAKHYDRPDPVNLGTGVETSIRETAELVAAVVGFTGRIVWDTSMPNGQPRRSLDPSRAKELFGFEAKTPLREGVERTVAWYRASAHNAGEPPRPPTGPLLAGGAGRRCRRGAGRSPAASDVDSPFSSLPPGEARPRRPLVGSGRPENLA
jgi:GDP-L-fucose synthase